MRKVRLANKIKVPLMIQQLQTLPDTNKLIKIAKKMKEYDPKFYYDLIYKFDLWAFHEDALGMVWLVAGIGTTIIDYTLDR